MSNILNHNRNIFNMDLNYSDYWDFHLSLKQGIPYKTNGLTERCLSSYIDTENPNCVWFDSLYSDEKYVWSESVNNGVELNNIGYTGIDNGLINYKKDRTSNKDFLNLFLNSKYTIKSDDLRLILNKVYGNNQLYDYFTCITDEDNHQVIKLDGGFYQGFFKLCGEDYKILPTRIENGWNFEITLKKKDFNERTETKLNDIHPENKGMFFFIGTRSENKWYKYYNVDEQLDKSCNSYDSNDYSTEFMNDGSNLNEEYIKSVNMSDYAVDGYSNDYLKQTTESYVKNDYVKNEYTENPCDYCGYYFDSEYLEKELNIDENMPLGTTDGYNIKQPNIVEYKTDNKFILFNRTKDGFTTENWDEDAEVVLHDIKVPEMENYFTLFNRTKDGYTTDTINKLIEEKSKKYSIFKDLYRNALGFQITDNGEIGYKYLVKDCEFEEGEQYKIESEFSKPNILSENEWHTVNIMILPNQSKNVNHKCENHISTIDKMTISIYIDGKLKLISKELPMLNLKQLDDLATKQEGVAYNISLGGGTQGLCDVVYPNFRKLPEHMLPLEKEFGGTFIGFIKSFKFYDCPLNVYEIQNNYEFEANLLKSKDIYKQD